MKTLTKMFLLCCWCMLSVTFAEKLHIDQIKANKLQQIVQQKEQEKIDAQRALEAQKEQMIQQKAEDHAKDECESHSHSNDNQHSVSVQKLLGKELTAADLAAKKALAAEKSAPVSIEGIFDEDKEALRIQMKADADAYLNNKVKEGERIKAFKNSKETAVSQEYNLQPVQNTEGEVVVNPQTGNKTQYNFDQLKIDQINELKENFDFDGPRLQVNPYSVIEVAPENGSRDGSVSIDVCSTDSYSSEVYYILLDTTNWWAWGMSGWTQHSAGGYGCENFSVSVPAGGYAFILADSWGDGGATATVNVNGESVGSVSTAASDALSYYSNLYEAMFYFDVTDSEEPVSDATVTFDLDGLDSCGFVSVTGTFDGWSGWGATTDTGMSASIPAGDHEFVILCVEQSTMDAGVAWWDDIWGNSTQYSAPIDGACWNGNYDYANYTLAVGADDMTVAYCAGTCDATCVVPCDGTEYDVTVGGGSWGSEVSWELDGNTGGVGDFVLCLSDGDNTLNMYDSYGDGWTGNSFNIDGQSFTLESGSEGSVTFCLGADCAPPTCDDEAACNTGAEGDCTYADPGYNCDGSLADGFMMDCVGTVMSTGYLSWQGDGYCDDGAFGVNFECCDYNFDNGDCGAAMGCDGVAVDCGGAVNDDCGVCDGDNSTCADCAGVANGDSFTDCAGTCLSASYTSWIGDGYCDDGAFGVDFVSCGDFNCDNGDCGTELLDDGTCGTTGCPDDAPADCAGVCGGDSFTDCAGTCLSAGLMSYLGDGYCDDGAWGVDFVSCGDFNCDNGDCGTTLLDDGTCGVAATCTEYSYVCDGSTWASEISWTIDAGPDALIASGGSPESGTLCLDDGDYTFSACDAYGDGWNGGTFTMTDADGNVVFASAGPTSGIGAGVCEASTMTLGGAPPVFGCTDPTAGNYNPDATVDDGSCASSECLDCEYDWSAYGAECCDSAAASFGIDCATLEGTYGWDCSGCACPLDPTCGDGVCEGYEDFVGCPDDCEAPPSDCLALTVGGGSYDSEITWEILDDAGASVEGGSAGSFTVCLDDGPYTFVGYDSWGDGWNGGSFELTDADGSVVVSGEVAGNSGSWYFCLGADCVVAGCMLEGAENYNADAVVDDGSCIWFPGMLCDYWTDDPTVQGFVLGCGVTTDHCWDLDAVLGNGECEYHIGWFDGIPHGLACEEFDCDMGDCSNCAGECLGADGFLAPDDSITCWDGSSVCDEADCPDSTCDGYSVAMYDSFGDGWNGNVLTIGDESYTIETGDFAAGCYTGPMDVIVSCGGGSWGSEVSWEISDADGNIVLSGGAPFEGCLGECDVVEPPTCDELWGACIVSLEGTEYYDACSAEDCEGGPGGACDADVVPYLTDECGAAAESIVSGACDDPCGYGGNDCVDNGGYQVVLVDAYGDGWNGNVLTIGDQTFTLDAINDNGEFEVFCYSGPMDVVVTCDGGSWQSEVSWAIIDEFGVPIVEGGAPYSGCFGNCDSEPVVPGCTDPTADNYNPDATQDDGTCLYGGCAEGESLGCSEQDIADGECASSDWIGDGLCDGYSEQWGVNNCCYDLDGGDCTEAECAPPADWDATITGLTVTGSNTDQNGLVYAGIDASWDALLDGTSCEEQGSETCWNGTCASDNVDGVCPEEPVSDCGACEFDWSNYGSECCDSAWVEFGINCATLEANYSWDCSGCACPGDLTCEEQGLVTCEFGSADGTGCAETESDCLDAGSCPDGQITGCSEDDLLNNECFVETWIGDGFCDGIDEEWGANLCCYEGPNGEMYDGGDCTPEECGEGTSDGDGDGDDNGDGGADECAEGTVADCSGDGDCCSEAWIGDGFCDDAEQAFGCDLMCYAGEPADCGARSSYSGNGKKPVELVINTQPAIIVDVVTGEMTYTDSYTGGNRAVSYDVTVSCDACLGGEAWSNTYVGVSDTSFGLFGFDADSDVCVSVVGVSTELGVTDSSDAVCATAGGCTDADADGVCDDVDDCVGEYDECGECNGDGMCYENGDVNMDGSINVTDIVAVVSYIVGGSVGDLAYSDMNGDGETNVTDIVAIVNIIMSGGTARVDDATEATITIAGNLLSVEGNGFIQGAQLTLTHDSSINIDLANEFVADYRTNGNTTTLVIATDGTRSLTDIATISGDYQIVESLVVGSSTEVLTDQVVEVSAFELKAAYPNPFNPTTSLDLVVPEAGYVSVKVYNLMGQEVATLVEGMMQQTSGYTMTWNASNMASGVYIVRAEGAGSVAIQKLMLLK